MKETVIATGAYGLMKVQDNTDGTDKTVDLFVASTTPIAITALPWSYSLDGVVSDTRTFNVVATTAWQQVSKVYVGGVTKFTFHIDDSGTTELGGPTDLTIDQLLGAPAPVDPVAQPKYVNVKVNGVYQKAIPYVKVPAGVISPTDPGGWMIAVPKVFKNSQWTEVQ